MTELESKIKRCLRSDYLQYRATAHNGKVVFVAGGGKNTAVDKAVWFNRATGLLRNALIL